MVFLNSKIINVQENLKLRIKIQDKMINLIYFSLVLAILLIHD